jgi:transforming growth factor-beta-induced protein
MKLKNALIGLSAISLFAALPACDDGDDSTGTGGTGGTTDGTGGTSAATGGMAATGGVPNTAAKNIVEIAAGNPDFSSLVAAVTKADLVATLSGAGPFTVFAPTNAAFTALLGKLDTTLDKLTKEALTPILTYHVVSGKVLAADVVKLKKASTVNGSDVRIEVAGSSVKIIGGSGPAMVTMTDIMASNGVIHVIDVVLLPPGDIPTVASGNADLSSLVAALTRANLVDALKADGPFTVFAPTNAAFTALLATNAAWKTLNDIPLATLTDVLKYHVVAGTKAYSEDVVKLTKVATLLTGKEVSINATAGVKLNGTTTVTAVDVLAKNGVVHVIDKVLLPPQ